MCTKNTRKRINTKWNKTTTWRQTTENSHRNEPISMEFVAGCYSVYSSVRFSVQSNVYIYLIIKTTWTVFVSTTSCRWWCVQTSRLFTGSHTLCISINLTDIQILLLYRNKQTSKKQEIRILMTQKLFENTHTQRII